MNIPIQSISRLLPQTQCRECGYEGCLPYARALSVGKAPANLCAQGGETVMKDIADLLGTPYLAQAQTQINAVA
ncbi:(Fe-S)-binding protein, partial [Neisseria sp. P0021.S007]|uniref:(Fe-S)-binding protein n=1 Tax=Neisseria sp. P0021.S007 TaxID=3436822 RepID=UPI003F7D6EA6